MNDYTIDVQFGSYGTATATVLSDTQMYVTTPAATTAGDVELGLFDSDGNYQPLNLNYTYTDPNDSDNDGIENSQDDCPNLAGNSTIDSVGCPDSDGDGYSNSGDAFPQDANEYLDSDDDGVGDNSDAFPNDPAETTDSDSDGVGDNADAFPNDSTETNDSDNDGVGDNTDAFPNDPTPQKLLIQMGMELAITKTFFQIIHTKRETLMEMELVTMPMNFQTILQKLTIPMEME